MRILQVITSLETGGAEVLVVNLVPRFRALGHEVDVCVFNGRRTPLMDRLEKENPGIRIYKLGRGYYNPFYILKLARIMRGYDIVHTHNSSPQLFVALSRVLCSVGLCTTEHNTSNRKRGWKWYALIDRWVYNRYNHIICISRKTQENLMLYIGNTSAKVCTIHNGINVEEYMQAPPLKDIAKNKIIITMVAGFRYQKDQETLIKAFALLDKDKYELWLVGDGEKRQLIENCIKELKVKGDIKFWGIRTDVPNILKSSDIVVVSSHWEGFGLAAVEGMAAGKPVIASNVDGLSQIVGGYGILFPHQNASALALEITKLAGNRDYYHRIVDRCMNRAEQFDIAKMVQGYHEVYGRIMEDWAHG